MKKLIIASTGIESKDISIKTIEKINSSDIALNFSSEGSNFLSQYIKTKIININEQASQIKDEFKKIEFLSKSIKQLFKKFSSVAFIVSGNPLFFNVHTNEIFKKFKEEKIKIEVIPAISSLDYVINIIVTEINPHLSSYLILTTPNLILSTPDSKYLNHDLIVMNLHTLNLSSHKKIKNKIIRIFKALKNRECYLIKYDIKSSKKIITEFPLGKIETLFKNVDNETTAYIRYN